MASSPVTKPRTTDNTSYHGSLGGAALKSQLSYLLTLDMQNNSTLCRTNVIDLFKKSNYKVPMCVKTTSNLL